MNRRSFFKLSAAATVAAAAAGPLRAVESEAEDASDSSWYTKEDKLAYEARSKDGSLRLRVKLFTPEGYKQRPHKGGEDEVTRYELDGKLLPEDFSPLRNLLREFHFTWNGRTVRIPERFWKDLSGFEVETSTLDPSEMPLEKRPEAEQFLADLLQPRLSLSTDKETALIEWQRSEDCDSRSTIRWMISRSGTILRHRSHDGCGC